MLLHGCTLAGSENLQYCYENSHHFSDKVNSMMCNIFFGYCLDVNDSPKFIPVVTWKFELLKTLIFSHVFTDHEK